MAAAEVRAARRGDLRHVSLAALPRELARLHGSLVPGARTVLRFGPQVASETRDLLLDGAGFERTARGGGRPSPGRAGSRAGRSGVRVERCPTLPDYVAPGLALLVCGLNPSLYAAETGVPFGRPGNRFWPAARGAGLIERDRDCLAALDAGLGFTDWVKRATRRAAEIDPAEYRAGLARIERLVALFQPRALCFVGLEGVRRALDRDARPGWSSRAIGGVPAYVMPSTSGLNAHSSLDALTHHLREASSGPGA